MDSLFGGLGLQESVVLNSFKVALIFRDLLSLFRNITALLDSCDRLNLHFTVHIRQKVLLGQILIVRHLCTHHRRLLHVTPCPPLLWGLWCIRLQLVHLVNQHHVFHIGNLICLLLDSLLLLVGFLLHLVLHLLVDLLLGG